MKKPRRHLMSWDELRWWGEMGWRRLRWQWDAVSNFQEKLRWDEIRWNENRFNIQETWHQIDKSRGCCSYRHSLCPVLSAIGVSNSKLPPPACPGTTCSTKLAQSTSQYYFVLQSLHKTFPSTTLYYGACTKHFPVLLETHAAAAAGNLNPAIPLQKSATKAPFATLMQPFRYDFWLSAAKDKSITLAAAAAGSLDAAIPRLICRHGVAKHKKVTHNGYTTGSYLQLQNRISTSKRKKDDFALCKRNLKKKISSTVPKWKQSAAKAAFATFTPQV